jgi:diaminopropionate ammonia-lyase
MALMHTLPYQSFINATARTWTPEPYTDRALEFHRSLDAYAPTQLLDCVDLAEQLGVERLLYKDESLRLGLPAFKVLGASWAIARAVSQRLGISAVPSSIEGLRGLAEDAAFTLVTATDGNHGRAVAWVARKLGLPSRIYVPEGLKAKVLEDIRDEGAELKETALIYDRTVEFAAESLRENDILIQDTSWPGYDDVPQWIVDGYHTLFQEIDAELENSGNDEDRLVVVPVGVGSLMQAAIEHFRASPKSSRTTILGVEPESAACVTSSLKAGESTTVDTSTPTVMFGLNCGTPSLIAWDALRSGLDGMVTVSDQQALTAVDDLVRSGIDAGACGAAPLAGLRVALADEAFQRILPNPSGLTVILIGTEGSLANPA